ncbi:MAG: permease-like cell division protein FtsX [Bacillota bacterium]|jgi:cell division transport system permease protein
MKIRTWLGFHRQAVHSMWRNSWMTVASIGTVAITMLIFGIFLLLAENMAGMAGEMESQVEISLYLQDEISSQQIDQLAQQLMSFPEVATVKYVSKEEALLRMREWYGGSAAFLDGLEMDNPLRNGFEVRTHQPQQVLELVPQLETLDGVAEVIYGEGVVEQLFEITRVMRLVAMVLMVGLALAATFIIANTIRITVFARRREVEIMRYVGATNWFIRWPFLVEGMLLGLIGGLMAGGLVSYLYILAVQRLAVSMPFLPLIQPWPLVLHMGGWVVLTGTVIGGLGSAVSLRRFLRV